MNRKQRRIAQSQGNYNPVIQVRGKACTIEEAIALAIQDYNSGNIPAAADIYRLILAQAPDHADANNNYSLILHAMGQYQQALASGNKAIAINPDCAVFYYNRGNTLHALKQFDASLADYDRAIALNFNHATLYNNRGITLQELKRYEEALASFDHAIALKADYAAPYYNRSSVLQALRRYEDMLASCDKAIALKADYADAYGNRSIPLREMKRYEEALASCDKAIVLKPDNAIFHYSRGITLQEMKRYDEALAGYDKAVALKPDYAEAYNNRGALLQELKRYDEAQLSLEKAIALKPDYADAYNNLGVILMNKGDMRGAEKMFLKALELRPDFTMPLLSLTDMQRYKDADHPHAKAIRAMLDTPADSMRGREYLYFSLGKIYDDCGRYDDAFECYRQANQIINKGISYNPAGVAEMTNTIMEVFSKEFLAQPFAFASDNRQPVFIVGMPRSGTTLMASILSSHPSVATAGELTTIIKLTLLLPHLVENGAPYPQAAKYITPDIAARLIHDYETRLKRDFGDGVPHIIDKHPHNFRHLGLIAMLFPKAKIIHCTRNPLDTCLSNYFQRFAPDYDYSFDLQNIGHFYGKYVRLMQHWREALPLEMIDISYEDMIMNTEQVARRALDYLRLEWDARCLAPHANPYAVETASRWQVRQPIYTQSVERWRHYEKHLAPLKEMLQLTNRAFS